ncbi:MAG: metal-dependent hydrolase [Steroidobacteraceae bacterium]
MEHASRTPADLVIHPRNLMIGRGRPTLRWWNGGDPIATAFYNGMSVAFPLGEAFFIDSVRKFRDAVPAHQQVQIDAFIKQEAAHSREHTHFNKQVHDAGYEVASLEADLAERLARAKDFAPVVNLANTVALEHFTAIIAHAVLKSDRHFRRASPDAARLWKWHAIEEIEHKAVAFDTFVAATKHISPFKRWKFRSLVMLQATKHFLRARVRNMAHFFDQDGINKPTTWLRAISYLLIYPGLLRQLFPAWLAFFRPGFHPWQKDDRALLARSEANLHLPGRDGALA